MLNAWEEEGGLFEKLLIRQLTCGSCTKWCENEFTLNFQKVESSAFLSFQMEKLCFWFNDFFKYQGLNPGILITEQNPQSF